MSKPSSPQISRRALLKSAGLAAAAVSLAPAAPALAKTFENAVQGSLQPLDTVPLPPLAAIALNRICYGPKPGQLDYTTFANMSGANDAAKLASFVDWQLNPNAISDTLCDSRLAAAGFVSLGKSQTQLWADYYEASNADRTLPVREVRDAAFIRAVYSQRQLYEVLVNFWHNHFNIYAWDYAYASATWSSYDRDVIRANALGNFRTLLGLVAKHPAMLFYLDNYINQSGGPNENWAREVFELHTLGAENYLGVMHQNAVPGYPSAPIGYVDDDVYEATRCFTGWRVNDGQWPLTTSTGAFMTYDTWHDRFQKTILGYTIYASASATLSDGEKVLDLLANHPGTARFICRKLCRRFVSDNPPDSLVNAAAAVFTANLSASDQLKKVVRFILLSSEFQTTWAEKLKLPFESTVGMLRAMNADFHPSNDFIWNYDNTNQPLFEHRPPDGYPDVKEAWKNTSSMLKRWQMAMSLTENWLDLTTVNVNSQMSGPTTANDIVDYWANRILGRGLSSDAMRQRLVDFMRGPYAANFSLNATYISNTLPRMVAVLLMSPDFHYR